MVCGGGGAAASTRPRTGPAGAIGGELHPIHAEIQDLLDQIVDRAEIYEKTGRPDEAKRLRAAVAEVIDDLMLRRSKARRLRERRRQKKSEGEDST